MEGRTARESMVAEIGTGGQISTGGCDELNLGARDPVDSNGYTCEPHARRRSEREGLGGFTVDGEARAAAMARRSALQLGGEGGAGTGRRGSLRLCKGGYGGALGRLYRLGVAPGGGSPAAMAINGGFEEE
jgi:hypothetical protein